MEQRTERDEMRLEQWCHIYNRWSVPEAGILKEACELAKKGAPVAALEKAKQVMVENYGTNASEEFRIIHERRTVITLGLMHELAE